MNNETIINQTAKKLANDDILYNARKVFTSATENELKLIKFAFSESNPQRVQSDLETHYRRRQAIALIKVANRKPESFKAMLTSAENRLKVNSLHLDKTTPVVGQILVSQAIYAGNVEFYQVVKTSPCFVTLQQIEVQGSENLDGFDELRMVRPLPSKKHGTSIRRKICKSNNGWFCNINDWRSAKPWNGQDIYEDSLN